MLSITQAIESWRKMRKRLSGSIQSSSPDENTSLIQEDLEDENCDVHPDYKIRLTRKFEPTELCEIFLPVWGKAAYMVVLTIYSFLASWSFATVAGSAWATNLPFNRNTIHQCEAKDFHHVLIPEDTDCRNEYMFCVLVFAVITVTLSLLEIREQAVLQMILGLLRFATIAGIILYAVAKLISGRDVCGYYKGENATKNETGYSGYSSLLLDVHGSGDDNSTFVKEYSDLSQIVFRFDAIGWLVSIPVFTYAFILHQGIPALTHPIKEKHLLRKFMMAMFGIALSCYIALGLIVPLWFKADIQETCTLNWVSPLSCHVNTMSIKQIDR